MALLLPAAAAEEFSPHILVAYLSRTGENYAVGEKREGSASAAYAGYIEKGNTATFPKLSCTAGTPPSH